MKLGKKLEQAINDQIQAEIYSAYLYLAMSAYCEDISMPGYAHWLRVQSEEEIEHAMKFFHYVNERGGRVILQPIQQPEAEFDSPLDVAKQIYEHEQKVTSLINDLYALATEEKDYAAQVFLQWSIDEQVEEEDSATRLVEMFEMIQDSPNGLFMLDQKLGARQDD
jgi:ferritin